MRMMVIKQDTDLDVLKGDLLKARSSGTQVDSAMAALAALNPHLDLDKLSAGQVVLVPDLPPFKVSVSDPVTATPVDQFRQLVSDSLERAGKSLRAAHAAASSGRADVTTALNTAALKRLVESDAALKQQVADVTKAFRQDQADAQQAETDFGAAAKAALEKLTQLSKLTD